MHRAAKSLGGILLMVAGMVSAAMGQSCNASVSTTNPVPAGANQQVVPHITTGGGFVTKFSIVNLSSSANQIVFNNIRQNGTPIDSTTCTIPANGTLRIATPEANRNAASETHWALVGSSQPVGVNLFFEFQPQGSTSPVNTVGFNDFAPRNSFTFPVELQSGSTFHTFGLAVSNPNNAATVVTVNLLDGTGTTRGSTTMNLAAFGQGAIDLAASLGSVVTTSNFIGSINVSASGGAAISAVGVGDDVGPFFSNVPMFVAAPSGGGGTTPNISATLTLSSTDAAGNISAGTCTQKGATATGATSSMTVAVSPSGDPTLNGLSDVIWSAFVDAPNHVTVQFCKFGKGNAVPQTTQTFNIRVLTSSATGGAGVISLPSGTSVASAACAKFGGNVTGAASTDVVVLTPPGDPANASLPNIQWQGFVDTPGHVKAEACLFGGGLNISDSALAFNVALIK